LLVEIDHFIECSTTGQRPRTDGLFGLKVVQVLEGVTKSSFSVRPAGADAGGTGRRGLMTATTAVPSGQSYMAHPLALVESDEIGEDTRIWAFAHVVKGARIGRGCNIGEHCYIEQGVRLGNNVTVKTGSTYGQA